MLAITTVLLKQAFCWGFYAHRQINYLAVFLLPPAMLAVYKQHIDFIRVHAVDPDKRRYIVPAEAARHYIDIDRYGAYPFNALPRGWKEATALYSADTLYNYGVVPWWIQTMMHRLTDAFRQRDEGRILRTSAEIGHYIADAHVPLHVCSNHNGQLSGQEGIHAFWESRVPELLAEKEWDFFIGRAQYIADPLQFTWARVLESAAAADSVLLFDRLLTKKFPPDQKFAFEKKNDRLVRQYSEAYTRAYNSMLGDMVERRMRQAIQSVASLWYTAWVNAGQPDLSMPGNTAFSAEELEELNELGKRSDSTEMHR